jgi:putative DNA methylase
MRAVVSVVYPASRMTHGSYLDDPLSVSQPGDSGENSANRSYRTLLERSLPFRELSELAYAERRAGSDVYGLHRWWARRPGSVFRGLLLAASLPDDVTHREYWSRFASSGGDLDGLRVHDPFMGTGTTLSEAARMGAVVSGTDIDPVAVEISRLLLQPPDASEVAALGASLELHLSERVGHLYVGPDSDWAPLHYFYIHEVTCPHCSQSSRLYRSLVLARDVEKHGGVRRDAPLTVFCPTCLRVHELADAEEINFSCCGDWVTSAATFRGQRFHCPSCQQKSKHRELRTGIAPRVLVAVEESSATERRRIRSAADFDHTVLDEATAFLARQRSELRLPTGELAIGRIDERPRSFGISAVTDLFSDRQLATFGLAFKWLESAEGTIEAKRAVTLAVSNALATNNKLCGYATDYGRLSPLFSIRSYSLPILAIELNPLHQRGGRGTLHNILNRLRRATLGTGKRYVWSVDEHHPVLQSLPPAAAKAPARASLRRASAEQVPADALDLVVFDPPYFDYIAYSELSEFFRSWWSEPDLGGKPLLPDHHDPVGTFGKRLGQAIRASVDRLAAGRPIVFTYHSANPAAWEAVGVALDIAEMSVTSLWPVRNDSHMGHHSFEGNCEWDVVITCRRRLECVPSPLEQDLALWERDAAPLTFSVADETSLKLASAMAATRAGRLIAAAH